jgi:NodT family efflux transporter outer membrane factor (OMF) lipoprotein
MTRRLAILSFAVLLAGCVPGGIVPQQTEISGTSVGLGSAPAPTIDKGWWTAFADPGLDSLMTEALKGNPGLGEAMARLRAAKAGVEAANATLYPRLDFNGQEQRERFSDIYIYPPPYAGSYRWIGTIEGDLSWNIDFWGKQAAQLDKAKALQTASRMDVEAARLALSSAVFQAYVDLDRAYKLADIAAQTERDGLDSKVEEQEAIALLAQARQARVSADSDRDVVVHELAALAGHGADMYAAIVRPTLNLRAALPLPVMLPADLLSRRPDIIAGQARIYAALEGRKAAKAAFYPDVDLLASVGWAAIGLGPLFQARSLQYGGGPAVHLPLFDAGALRAQYSGAVADIDSAIADYNGTLVNAVRETADALTRIRSLNDQLAEEHRLLNAAESGYRLAATRYRSGLSTQLTVLDAQNILFEARQGDVSLKAQQVVQRVTLLVAVGGGFQAPTPTETSSR